MALPKPSRPEYSTTIPSTGKKIKYQSFTVREEKVLILAAESEDQDEIANAIDNVLSKCITTPNVSVRDLALFDIEFLFLKARAKSIGEKIDLRVTDPNDPTYTADHSLNIDTIKVKKDPEHKDLIAIDDEIQIKMGYPGLDFFSEGLKIETIGDSLETIAKCVQSIVIGEEVYNRADMSNEEILEWLEALTSEQFNKLMVFFRTMPKLTHTIKLTNPKTGNKFEVVLNGLSDFF